MGNLTKVKRGRSKGKKSGADFGSISAEEVCPFAISLTPGIKMS